MATAKSKKTSHAKSAGNIKRRRITFSFDDDDAKEVILVGDFNNWNPKKHAMKSDGKRSWNKTVVLAPGRYEYKFFVDGKWKTDPRNSHACANCFGTQNSVLNIEKR